MTAEPTAPVASARHARGTWTPDVAPGSGGRRRVPGKDPIVVPTVALPDFALPGPGSPAVGSGVGASPHSAARAVLDRESRLAVRGPIRYDDVPGAPRRSRTEALWGPPIPAAGA